MNKPQPQPIQKLQQKDLNPKSSSSRKRTYSASSTDSPGNFSNYFSDSGTSSMTSAGHLNKKRSTHNSLSEFSPSSAESSSNSSNSLQSSSSSSLQSTQKVAAQRSVPAFLNKLYNMVDDPCTNDLVRWSGSGNSFIVERHEEFAKTVLPRFYKHNTFASFVRQLNMYDFHKIPHIQQGVMIAENVHEIWEFSNPHFQRKRPDLLILVTRKKNKDKDPIGNDSPTVHSLADDLSLVKNRQANMGDQLKELHRDNEIIWHETLNSRDKYYRHQEAIEKILLFLTAVFSSDQISGGEGGVLPKNLIEEAATLAEVTIKQEDVDRIKSQSGSLGPGALTNVLSSVLKLYSEEDNLKEIKKEALVKNHRPEEEAVSLPTSLNDFSHTIDTATRSANSITQDIDMLQMNIESLANNLGIDPNLCDNELDMDHFQANYDTWQHTKLYNLQDLMPLTQNNPSFHPSALPSYTPPLFQRRQKKQEKNTPQSSLQPQVNFNAYPPPPPDSDSFGPNYPSSDLSEYEEAIRLQQRRQSAALHDPDTKKTMYDSNGYLDPNPPTSAPSSLYYKKR
ncbi:hypothetical protein BY458DRAFT_152876 [Sporodiniella umbellata]|nr:hypothetical protein BY458DRAFT_152876 [Sporodiniella umbellata]